MHAERPSEERAVCAQANDVSVGLDHFTGEIRTLDAHAVDTAAFGCERHHARGAEFHTAAGGVQLPPTMFALPSAGSSSRHFSRLTISTSQPWLRMARAGSIAASSSR